MFLIGYIAGFVVATVIYVAINRAATEAPCEPPDWDGMANGDADRLASSEELTW